MPDFRKKIVRIFAVCAVLVLAVGTFVLWDRYDRTEIIVVPVPAPITLPPVVEPEPEPEPVPLLYPVGKFGPDQLRLEYISEEMILRVPRMNFEGPVYSGQEDITKGSPSYQGVSNDTLYNGVGLFGAAQVPTDSNSNVSIAGHRDIRGKEFWDIDKMGPGDYMYLEYRGKEYVYLYEDSLITTDNDWEPVRTKDYGCITLQSCTPINVASHRIFVVGRLMEIRDLPERSSSQDPALSSSQSGGGQSQN